MNANHTPGYASLTPQPIPHSSFLTPSLLITPDPPSTTLLTSLLPNSRINNFYKQLNK